MTLTAIKTTPNVISSSLIMSIWIYSSIGRASGRKKCHVTKVNKGVPVAYQKPHTKRYLQSFTFTGTLLLYIKKEGEKVYENLQLSEEGKETVW